MVFFIVLFLFALTESVLINSFDIPTYVEAYRNNNIEEASGLSLQEYEDEIKKYEIYLTVDIDSSEFLGESYTENEKLHMEDVQKIFHVVKKINSVTYFLMIAFVCMSVAGSIKKKIIKHFYVPYLLPIIIAVPIWFNFDKAFIAFHKIFFRNDLWIMDPNKSLMIRLLPQELFFGLAKLIVKKYYLYITACLLFILTLVIIDKIVERKKNGAE